MCIPSQTLDDNMSWDTQGNYQPLTSLLKYIQKIVSKCLALPNGWNSQTEALGFVVRKHLWKKFISCRVNCTNSKTQLGKQTIRHNKTIHRSKINMVG